MHWTALSPKNVETTDRIGHFFLLIYHQLAFSSNTQSYSLAIQKNRPYAFVVSMYSEFIIFRAANTAFVLSTAFSSVILPLSKAFWISFNRFFIRRFVLESRNILLVVIRQPKNGTPRKVANRRVIGVVVPRTTPFDTVRTRRRAEP